MEPETRDDFLTTSRVLLVSPHLDDAVLSCEALVGRAEALDVLTVCTGRPNPPQQQPWDLRGGFADSEQAMTDRLVEDDDAFIGTPHRRHRLDLLDAQYLPGVRDTADYTVLTHWVDRWLADQQEEAIVVLPVGAGIQPMEPPTEPTPAPAQGPSLASARSLAKRAAKRVLGKSGRRAVRRVLRRTPEVEPSGWASNADHRWVRDVLAAHLIGGGATVACYEEVPYRSSAPGDVPAESLAGRLGCSLHLVERRIDTAAKARRVACYRSQVPLLSDAETALDTPRGLPDNERYWLLRRA